LRSQGDFKERVPWGEPVVEDKQKKGVMRLKKKGSQGLLLRTVQRRCDNSESVSPRVSGGRRGAQGRFRRILDGGNRNLMGWRVRRREKASKLLNEERTVAFWLNG